MSNPQGLSIRIHNLAEQIKDLFHQHHGDQLPDEVNQSVQTLQAQAGKLVSPDQPAPQPVRAAVPAEASIPSEAETSTQSGDSAESAPASGS